MTTALNAQRTAARRVTIGSAAQQESRARVLAIGQGRHKPKPGEPKIWFTSMKSLAEAKKILGL